ncbi:hypothetical protein [Neptunicella sp. SCSIO 80796]|uniref:hypothetical protein n=1 Tax=Neptunicella plasticusilytica TaxID=3117012 RepID=UPI003A4DA17A
MGFLGGGFFGSGGKADSGNTSTDARNYINNVDQANAAGSRYNANPISINVSGKSNDGNISIQQTDYGAIDAAERVAQYSADMGAYGMQLVTESLNDNIERGLDSVDNAVLGNQSVVELSLMNSADQNNTLASALGEANQMNSFIAENALNFGRDALDSNTGLAEQFGADLKSLASDFGGLMADTTQSAFIFADNQNAYLAQALQDGNQSVSDALKEMAMLQEQGLDNALDVASSISMDDAAEASTSMVKYLMLGLTVFGVAMVFKG